MAIHFNKIQMSNSTNLTKTLLAFAAGAAIGGILGVLFAPEKGIVTRKKITSSGDDFLDLMKSKLNDLMDEVTRETEIIKKAEKDLFAKKEELEELIK